MSRSTAGTYLQTLDKAARDEGLSTLRHSTNPFMGEMEVRNDFHLEGEPWVVLIRFAYQEDGTAIITLLDGKREEVIEDDDPYIHAKVEIPTHGEDDEQVAERAAKMVLPAIKAAIT